MIAGDPASPPAPARGACIPFFGSHHQKPMYTPPVIISSTQVHNKVAGLSAVGFSGLGNRKHARVGRWAGRADGEDGAAARMRLEPQTPGHVTAVLRRFLAAYSPEKLTNLLAVVAQNKVRLRSLQAGACSQGGAYRPRLGVQAIPGCAILWCSASGTLG